MKILVVGGGAREHAMCWKLCQSPNVKTLYCAPGNPGIAAFAQILPISVADVNALVSAAKEHAIDLTIIGPELPLALGIVDAFESRGLRIFGPTKRAAALEASKSFAKDVMNAAGVATARGETFFCLDDAARFLKRSGPPVVLKADGLASGKGVFVCSSHEEIEEGLRQIFSVLRSDRIVVEEYLSGREVSFIAATDGERVVPFASSHDYKRLLDGQRGPNTGGMGAVSPSLYLPRNDETSVINAVLQPVLHEMTKRGAPFRGFIYAGLMVGANGDIKVLEFNARLGDPECQVLLRRLNSDLLELICALHDRTALPNVQWRDDPAVGVVLAADGYPNAVRSGDEISGIEFAQMVEDALVFHAGTVRKEGKLFTSGGRVLTVTATGTSIKEAASRAYRAADIIQFKGLQLRRDIGSE